MTNFVGRVWLRSSLRPEITTEPPAEREIQQRNPHRVRNILRVTGWKTLECGSLNLRVDNSVVDALAAVDPVLVESAAEITYPPGWEHILEKRKGYWYYSATATNGEITEEVLVRRGIVPLAGVVELFARVSLMERFKLIGGDSLAVEIRPRRTDKMGA